MRVFISSDMEGTAGVVDWSQCVQGQPEYEYYRTLLQGEVNAAIEGAQAAGADEFLVNDSHSKMQNLRPDGLAGNARYLSGRHKPMYMMQGSPVPRPEEDPSPAPVLAGSRAPHQPGDFRYAPTALVQQYLGPGGRRPTRKPPPP